MKRPDPFITQAVLYALLMLIMVGSMIDGITDAQQHIDALQRVATRETK